MIRKYDYDAGYSSQQNSGSQAFEYRDKCKTTTDVTNAYAVGEISSSTRYGFYTIKQPTADSLIPAKCALLQGSKITSNKYANCIVMPIKPMLVAYDTGAGNPLPGDQIGTVAGSWKMSVGKSGWYVLSVSTEGLCLVRPFSSTSYPLVQILTHTATDVSVKNISYDLTQFGSAYDVKRLLP